MLQERFEVLPTPQSRTTIASTSAARSWDADVRRRSYGEKNFQPSSRGSSRTSSTVWIVVARDGGTGVSRNLPPFPCQYPEHHPGVCLDDVLRRDVEDLLGSEPAAAPQLEGEALLDAVGLVPIPI